MLAAWYGLLFLGETEPVKQTHGTLIDLGRYTRRNEKKLVEETEELIEQIKEAVPEQKQQIQDDSQRISRELKAAIAEFTMQAHLYEDRLKQEARAQYEYEQLVALQQALINAQIQAEQLQQQADELDVVYIMFMLIAQEDH